MWRHGGSASEPSEDGEQDDATQGQRPARPAAGAVTVGSGHVTAYKAPTWALAMAVVGLTLCYVSLQSGLLASDPDAVLGWSVSLPLLALFALLLCWLFRRATLVSDEGIGVRGLAGTRWIPWADIQVIAVERNVNAWMSSGARALSGRWSSTTGKASGEDFRTWTT
jgi:hypothetical protein